jgi:hypothetical protein
MQLDNNNKDISIKETKLNASSQIKNKKEPLDLPAVSFL